MASLFQEMGKTQDAKDAVQLLLTIPESERKQSNSAVVKAAEFVFVAQQHNQLPPKEFPHQAMMYEKRFWQKVVDDALLKAAAEQDPSAIIRALVRWGANSLPALQVLIERNDLASAQLLVEKTDMPISSHHFQTAVYGSNLPMAQWLASKMDPADLRAVTLEGHKLDLQMCSWLRQLGFHIPPGDKSSAICR